MAQDSSGIMALPTDQAQPAAPNPAVSPENMAVFEQLRQNISPKEFSDELLNTAAQADPQAVAEFKAELEGLDVPPEVLDLLDRLIDEVLANPDNYDEIRQKYIAQGVSEDMLPEQFDPEFFAAINIALNQVRGEPAGPQAFAKGGIAELKPIAKALASYGRDGDTMLAHITPAEARMLKKRGGAGTINPVTGLPEYRNIFSKIASAGKKFLRSTVGRVIMTVALGFFLGPAAAGLMGVTSTAGVAAVGGFIGSAGSTLLAGGSARDALKAGAIGGLTAGITQGVMGEAGAFEAGSYQGPTTVSGQVERFTGAFSPESAATIPEAPVQQTAPQAPAQQQLPVQQSGETFPVRAGEAPVRPLDKYDMLPESVGNTPMGMQGRVPDKYDMLPESVGNTPMGMQGQQQPPAAAAPSAVPTIQPVAPPVTQAVGTEVGAQQFGLGAPTAGDLTKEIIVTETPSFTEQIEGAYKKYLSPSDIEARGIPAAQKAGADAVAAADRTIPRSITGEARAAMLRAEYTKAYNAAMPGPLTKYGPMAAVGLGITGLAGGFKNKPASQSPLMDIMMGGPGSANYLLSQNPYQYYIQNLPGVSYAGGRPRGYADGGVATQEDGGGIGSAGTTGTAAKTKTLSPAVKSNLATLLTTAQQTNNYTALNAEIKRLGLTRADLLANFPAITAAAIDEQLAKGMVLSTTGTSTDTGTDTVTGDTGTDTVTGDTGVDTVPGATGNEVTPPVQRIAGVTPVSGIGTAAIPPEQVEVASPTLRAPGLPTDARSVSIRGAVGALGANPSAAQISALMDQRGIGPAEIAAAFNLGLAPTQAAYYNARNAATLGGYAVNPITGGRTAVSPNLPAPITPSGSLAPIAPVAPPMSVPTTPSRSTATGAAPVGAGAAGMSSAGMAAGAGTAAPAGQATGTQTTGTQTTGTQATGTQTTGTQGPDANIPKLTPVYTPSKPGYASFVALDKSVKGGRLMAYDNYGNALSSIKPTESGYKDLDRLLVDPESYKKALQDLHEYEKQSGVYGAWTEQNWAGQKALFDKLAAEYKPLEREENGQQYLMTTGTDPTKDATRFFGGDLSMARHDIVTLMKKSGIDFITATNLLYANPYKKVAQAVVDWDKVMAAPDPAKALMAAYAAIAADPNLSQFGAQAVTENYTGWKDKSGSLIADPTKGVYQSGVLVPPGTATGTAAPAGTAPGGIASVQTTPKFTDEQVIAAARSALQAGLSPQEVLNRGSQMGLTQDQLARGLAALQASGYSGLTMPGAPAPAPAPAPQPTPTSFVPPTTGGIADLPMGNVTTPTEPVTTAATPTTTPGGIASLPTAPVVTAPVTPTVTTPTIPTAPVTTAPVMTAPVTTAPTTPVVPSVVPPLIPAAPAPTYTPPSLMEQEEETQMFNYGGIASLTRGGYPRRNGQISGPGTEKSDSIPAMLSDGEFVMTARAVRGLGNGSRREGAKKMYALMNRLEKNASRA